MATSEWNIYTLEDIDNALLQQNAINTWPVLDNETKNYQKKKHIIFFVSALFQTDFNEKNKFQIIVQIIVG